MQVIFSEKLIDKTSDA